ncbi:MAG: acriflavine resistance protein B [Cyanobacteria bacterium PR.3.49]|jgi:HAE1 family hydrophobic/amphiphilic exporter-1|nr:acriflavine resistance protein B [Cyanobacteria bacterium PR.3.49]
MNFAGLFIRRPIFTTLLMSALVLFGIISFTALPVNDLPSIDFPTISVSASLPGANPATMANAVATPLERQFATIAGISSMNSTSSLGSTSITLQFDLTRDIDAAAQDVQTAIAAATRLLPVMPTPPTYRKVNPADSPILYLSLSSDSLPLYKVDEYAETTVAQRLSMLEGVAQVNVFGGQKYAVRIDLSPDALTARNVGFEDVTNAIVKGNVNLPAGTLYGPHSAFMLRTNGPLSNAEQFSKLVVTYKSGSPVVISDLGKVTDSVENDKQASWYNGKRAIVLAIMRQPGTNTVEIVDSIKKILPELRQQIPGSVSMDILYDRTTSIRASIEDVEFTLVLTIGLVVLVIFLFLRNVPATIIPSLALPTSLVGTFAAMHLLGFSLNNLSLMALTLSVGFVVDDAVVVLENIVRHMEMGKRPFQAAMDGTKEITFTILSMTLSLVAVFLPILLMGGIVGRLFNEFAVTMAVSILISGFVSLTLTPMLSSRWLTHETAEKQIAWLGALEKGWDWLARQYEVTLKISVSHPRIVLALLIAGIALTAWLFMIVPKGFMPTQDTGQISGSTEAAQDISFENMSRHQKAVADIVQKNEGVRGVMSSIGGNAGNVGRVLVALKPFEERKKADEIVKELRPQLAQVPGINTFLQIPPAIRIGGMSSKSSYQVTLMSPEQDQLYKATLALREKMENFKELADVNTDIQSATPQIDIKVNRAMAAALGITQDQVEQTLASAYGQRQVSTIYAPTNQYKVLIELEQKYQRDPVQLSKLYIRSTSGKMVPLGAIAQLTPGTGPLAINHLGQFPSATISFNLRPGFSIGQAVDHITEVANSTVPATVSVNFQGQAQAFQQSFSNLGWLLLLATVIIYVILGMLYESFIHPLTILSGLPAAGLGAMLILLLFKVDLDIYGFLGLILLIGIVKKNAIMMIDFSLELEREKGMPAKDAIYQACLVRFRPIMMTTMAALMGTLPIAFGAGAGADTRRPLGLVVVGGLIVSQILTLYITPVVYVWFDTLLQKLRKDKPAPRESFEA